MTRLSRWPGWGRAAVVLQRGDGRIATLRLTTDLPLSVRRNTDDSVGNTVRHDEESDAWLGELRARAG